MRVKVSVFAVTFLLAPGVAARAQMHHVDAPETVTRAVGVYEWTGELGKPSAARLVPVSLFISGQFEQAGTYLARPVPLALETGNVYSVEKAGEPEGVLDLKLARDVASQRAAADDNPIGAWYGFGEFHFPSSAKKAPLKASVQLASVNGSQDDDRPHFVTSRPQAADSTPAAKSSTVNDEDPEKPTLGRRDDATAAEEKEKKPKKARAGGYVTGMPNGLNADDPDRPTLRHGVAPSDDVPPLDGLPPGMHQAVAVSDPAVHDPHDFARAWDSAEERAEALRALQTLAGKDVRAYLTRNGLLPATAADAAAPAAPKLVRTPHGIATHHAAASAPASNAALVLTNEELHGYNLSYGGLPTFVYTAEMPVKPAKAETADLTLHCIVIAQRLPSGDLQVALHAATDSGHLDRLPWMRFLDVVDADSSHRASFLIEERAAHSRQFALYRLVSATAEQTFVTGLLE
jgi:hypothetical protein